MPVVPVTPPTGDGLLARSVSFEATSFPSPRSMSTLTAPVQRAVLASTAVQPLPGLSGSPVSRTRTPAPAGLTVT
jgi:hypothetical protein